MKGFITEQHLVQAEKEFPGIKSLHNRLVRTGKSPNTFLDLLREWMNHSEPRRGLKNAKLTKVGHQLADEAPLIIEEDIISYIEKVASTPRTAIAACLSAHRSGNTKLAEAIYGVAKMVHGPISVAPFFDLPLSKRAADEGLQEIRLLPGRRMYPVTTKEAAEKSLSTIGERWNKIPINERVTIASNLKKYAAFIKASPKSVPGKLAKYAGFTNRVSDESRFNVALGPRRRISIQKFGYDKYASLKPPTPGNAGKMIEKIASIDRETGADWLARRGVLADPGDVVFAGPPITKTSTSAPTITAHGIKIDISRLGALSKRDIDSVVPGLGDEIFDADGDLDIGAATTIIQSLPMDIVQKIKKRFNL